MRKFLKLAFLGLALTAVSPAAQIVVDFNDLAGGSDPFSYSSGGITFTITGPDNDHFHDYTGGDDGSIVLATHTDCCSNSGQITYSGGAFAFISFYLDSNNTDPEISGRFVASDGTEFFVDGSMRGTTVNLPAAFANVTFVDWFADSGLGNGDFAIDNVVFDDQPGGAVPEPSTMSLLAGGLMLGWFGRRFRK